MLHEFKYSLLTQLREKQSLFWLFCFPLLLSTAFYSAFGNLYEDHEVFQTIPIAVVAQTENEWFSMALESVSEGEDALFAVTEADRAEAETLLQDKRVEGIVFVGKTLSLTVRGSGVAPSILQSFLEQYAVQEAVIKDIAAQQPERLDVVMAAMSQDLNCLKTEPLTQGSMDPYAHYFFALLAMVAMMGSSRGLQASVSNQANLSPIGARKTVSPIHKFQCVAAHTLSSFLVQSLSMCVCISYILFVLRVDMGEWIVMLYVAGLAGTLTGVAMGYCIGAIPGLSETVKVGISIGVTLGSSLFSGLYVAEIKAAIMTSCPLLNDINPTAVVVDLFYCLSMYEDYDRFLQKLLILGIMTLVFLFAGFLMTRRKRHASL